MYTLKIRQTRHASRPMVTVTGDNVTLAKVPRIDSLEDETTLFIEAKEVRVHGFIEAGTRETVMKAWDVDTNDNGYWCYLNTTTVETDNTAETHEDGGRLIQVIKSDGEDQWYLASLAWLLGPNGNTIERVAP